MVKADRSRTDKALRALESGIRGVLVFGRDEGLIRERADILAAQVVDDIADPFRVARITQEALRDSPTLIGDEMSAISMLGGRRLVRIDGAADWAAEPVRVALTGESGDSLLLAVAGDLPPRSKLRTLFEKAKDLLAIPCYPDEGRDLAGLVRETLTEPGLGIAPDAQAALIASLGSDRQVSRRELEKLVLYKLDDSSTTVNLDDVRAVVGNASAMAVSQIAEAVTGGEPDRLDALMDRAFAAGESPVAILRIVSRRLQQMHRLRGHMAQGLSADQAAGKLRPPLFYKEKDAFLRHAQAWSPDRVAQALTRLLETEAACKSTGMPAETICARSCMALAATMRRRG